VRVEVTYTPFASIQAYRYLRLRTLLFGSAQIKTKQILFPHPDMSLEFPGRYIHISAWTARRAILLGLHAPIGLRLWKKYRF
jgi:hypothetical protein